MKKHYNVKIKSFLCKMIRFIYPSFKYLQKSYSQDGEDLVLKAIMNKRYTHNGFYVDVGAHHPFRFSNTAIFYKKGWKGINIEPTPNLITAFNKYRKRDINLNVGIAEKEGELTFYEFDEPALNSFNKDLSVDRNNNTSYNIISQKQIKVFTLEQILDKYMNKNQNIDFITIDVEGLDLSVLSSNNWEKYRPNYVLVEAEINFEEPQRNEIYAFLSSRSYELIGKTLRTLIFRDQTLICNN